MSDDNVFRPEYRELDEEEKEIVENIKTQATVLIGLFDSVGADERVRPQLQRQLAVARTKLEESVMWAVKGVTGPVGEDTEEDSE